MSKIGKMSGYYDYHPVHQLTRPVALVSFVNQLTRGVASSLASLGGLRLVLLDDVVQHQLGASVGEVVTQQGLSTFRQQEKREVTRAVASRPMGIIALGEGALSDPESRRLVLEETDLVYLYLSFDEARERARDQSFQHKATLVADIHERECGETEGFEALFAERRAGYENAHLTLDVWSRSVNDLVSVLLDRLSSGSVRPQ